MFTITTRPPGSSPYASASSTPSTHRKHAAEEEAMDVDFEEFQRDLGEGSSTGDKSIVSPGEPISSAKEFMRGHGTYVESDQVISSVTGTIERVNKLISVRALKSRYNPEVGDLVIGRIVEVGASRWRVDVNARQDAVLMLSSVNLPGGVQRRKIESDALKMREFLAEGDLLVAEVQAFFQDGAMSLHTRSLKYGKLRNGHLLILPPRLIRRLKSHFHHLPPPCGPTGVDIIMGLNGFIWVSAGMTMEKREGGEGFDAEGVYSDKNDDIDTETRKAIAMVSSIINIFAAQNIPITDALITDAYAWSSSEKLPLGPLSESDGRRLVAELTGLSL